MKQQEIVQALTFAFQLQNIVERVHSQHCFDHKNKEKRREALSVAYIMTEDGRPILQLFGYHLAIKLGQRSFYEMGRSLMQILVNQSDFGKYCETVWPDMGNYERVIPVLFRTMNTYGVVPLRRLDLFVEICRKQINPFMAEIKENVPASQIKKLRQKLVQQCQREDLLGNGYAEKLFLEEIMKKQLKVPIPEWPKQLYHPTNINEINYRMLLGPKYLNCGSQVDKFLKSMFVRKIVRALKKAAKQLKQKGKKKEGKKVKTTRTLKPAQKKNKHQKLLQKYIEANKPKKSDEVNRNEFMIKSLVEQIIASVVQLKYDEGFDEQKENKVLKSVYITEPEFPQIEYDVPGIEIRKIKFVGNNGLGLFVSGNKGYIMDNMKSVKKSEFFLNLSYVFKQSPILQYQVLDNVLYLLKENGLLYSWPITGDTFLNQIQTSFSKPSSPPDAGVCNFLKIKDGLVIVNCTHNTFSRFQIYSLDLVYIGIVQLNQSQFNLSYKICQQAQLLQKMTKGVLLDKKITNIQDYKQLFGRSNVENFGLGTMLCNSLKQFTLNKFFSYLKWILSFRKINKIMFPSSIIVKIKADKKDPELMDYLLRLGYINEATVSQIQRLQATLSLDQPQNRKTELVCLLEDNSLDPIKSQFLSKEQFMNWVAPACLMALQLKKLTESLQYRPDGKIDMSKLYYNQHYRRLSDARYNRFVPQRYKCLEIPPVCVKQFAPIPTKQTIVLSLCFPLAPYFYVVNMLNGELLNSFDMSAWTSLSPKMNVCDKNGYIFMMADKSVSLWSPTSLSTSKQLAPIKNWVNLQSSQIIDLVVLYELSTVITLTADCIKLWDFDQMCKKKEFTNIFTLKPGYKAIQNKVNSAKNYKKKILLRQTAVSLFYFISPNESIVAGAISLTKSKKFYVKSFTVNKFNVAINSQKEHYQIPTKLVRELQTLAMKRKNLPIVVKDRWMNELQKLIQYRMAQLFKLKLNSVTEIAALPTLKPELQHKIGLLSHSVSSIYTRSMFKNNEEAKRLENIFSLITIQNRANLEKILQPKFLELYRINDKIGYDLDRMLQDCMSTKQKKTVNRVLYLLSLIQKFSRTTVQAGTKISKLISQDRNTIDQAKVLSILPSSLPLDSRIVTKAIKLINSLSQPLLIATKIINSFLPTRYRFLVPRYIRQIYGGKQSAELNEYISNHYENQPTVPQVLKRLQQGKLDNIQLYIEQKNLGKFLTEQLLQLFPLAANCNYSLIEAMMCLKMISEDEAYHYCVKQSIHPGQRLSSRAALLSQGDEEYLDAINEHIEGVVTAKNIRLPYPTVSYQFFKKNMYNGSNADNFFFGYLQADKNSEQVLSEKLQLALQMVKKKLCLRYKIQQWRYMMGDKIKLLKPFLNDFLERFPLDFRVASVTDVKTVLMSLIGQEKVYEDLVKRIAYSCTSSKQKKQAWSKGNGDNLEVQGMWVNINHLLRFIQDYNPMLLDLQTTAKEQKPYILKLPAYNVIARLTGDFNLLSITKFRQLLTLNLHPISLTDMETILEKYFRKAKKVNVFELKSLMPDEYVIFGRYLIDKYHRLDFQHRFTVVNGNISSTQLVQLFNSKAIANYLFGDQDQGLPQFLPFQQIITSLKKHLLDPAAVRMSTAFALALEPQLLELVQYHLVKTTSMPVLLLSQLLHSNHSEQPIIICLLKFMTLEPSSAQLIDLNNLLNAIKKIKGQTSFNKYETYRNKLSEKTKDKNIIELFLEQAQPQNLPFTDQDPPKSYIISLEHMSQILDTPSSELEWFINCKPYANVRDFIDHVRKSQREQQDLQKTISIFTENCICRVGIDEIMSTIGDNCSFANFYYKIRQNFKTLTKLDSKSILLLYNAIVKASKNGKCDSSGMRNLCGQYIPVHKKMEWICALYDRQLITNPLEQEELTLDSQLKIQKLKNLYDSNNGQAKQKFKEALKKSLSYHKYLVNKYLSNDPTKMKQLSQCVTEKKLDEARNMLEVFGVTQNLHLEELIKYFVQEYQVSQGKKFMDDCSLQEIKSLIELIRSNFITTLDSQIRTPQQVKDPSQSTAHLAKILQSPVYHQFITHGSGEYYCTFHSLLSYCQSLLHAKLTSSFYLHKVQDQIREFLIRKDLTPAKLYELLDLSTMDNIVKYLPEVVLQGGETDTQIRDLITTATQLARPQRMNLKYPINSNDFLALLSDVSSKNQKNRKQYQYLYSDLDILGTGYVNLNDIPKYRGNYPPYLSPYVSIPSFIDFLLEKDKVQEHALPSKYIGPILDPPQDKSLRLKIKQKLLKYQLPVRKWQKTKLIKPDVCLAVLGEFGIAQNHQYHEFIKQKFIMVSNGLLDLSGVIDWLMESLIQEREEATQKEMMDEKATKLEKLVQAMENDGGLYSYVSKMKKESKHITDQLFSLLLELSESGKTQLFIGGIIGTHKFDHATQILKNLAQKYFRDIKKWDTFNNHFCRQIKNMAQMYYSLVFKFYYAHSGSDMHQIYSNVSQGGELTLLTLWRYIQDKGITGYSRADINELFSAIDINSDKRLSYFQFCQFWMACQQLFANENRQLYQVKTKIDQINSQVKDAFIELCSVELDAYPQETLNIEDLVKFTNIPNVQKVDYVVRAVNSASMTKGPVSGAFDTKIQVSKSKLKIIMDKTKANQATDLENLREDLILSATEPEIAGYQKQGYNSDSISKIIVKKYPRLGYQIVQHLYDLCRMDTEALKTYYKDCNKVLKELPVSHSKQDRLKFMQQLVGSIEEGYRKHPLKIRSYEHRQFASSIAFGLMAEQVANELVTVSKEVDQICNFISRIEVPNVPLYYQLEHVGDFPYPDHGKKMKSINADTLKGYPYKADIGCYDRQYFKIKFTLHSKIPIKLGSVEPKNEMLIHRQIVWKDTDTVCKSESKVNLLMHANLYNDPEISLIPINQQQSSRFKIEGTCQYKPDYELLMDMVPYASQQGERDNLIDRVMSTIKHLAQKIAYCYYKHGVTGLLVMPESILVNRKDNSDIKMSNFISCLALNRTQINNRDQTVNYIDGIDPKFVTDCGAGYPPECKQGVLTEAIDVYILVHLVFRLFAKHLGSDSDSVNPGRHGQQESIWDWNSPLHEVSTKKLKQFSQNMQSEKEYNMWVLLYECSHYDWFMRPRLHQLMQVLQNYFETATLQSNLFAGTSHKQQALSMLQSSRISDLIQLLATIPFKQWHLQQIVKFKQGLTNQLPIHPKIAQIFNQILEAYAKNDAGDSDPQKMRLFLSTSVDYVLMVDTSLSFLANICFKNILNSLKVLRYLDWCDQNWKIEEYQVNKKIEKINMQDKLEALHKSSSFYHDISTLVECRSALSEKQQAKRSQTSKKVAISFIETCLVSNNINKIYAIYRSRILSSIYCYLNKPELEPYIIRIFQIATSCFNPNLTINRFRAVDQVYKVMMVISNSIKVKQSPTKLTKQTTFAGSSTSMKSISNNNGVQNQSVVSMQDFVNNYYTLSGQQCREVVLLSICREQLCTLPVLTYLLNQLDVGNIANIIVNLSYDKKSEKIMRSPVVGGYVSKLKQAKMDHIIAKIGQAVTRHTQFVTLGDLSTSPFESLTYPQLLTQHLKYYEWYCQLTRSNSANDTPLFVNYQRNFHAHFQSLIAKSQRIYDTEIAYVQNNQNSLQIVRLIAKIHRVMFQIWTRLPCHPDFTAGTLRFLMKFLEDIHQDENIYVKSKINSEVSPDILFILQSFILPTNDGSTHNLMKIAISNGFIQFYCRIMRKQHTLMQKYIDKNVENIHLTQNYHPQAEFRLICYYQLIQNVQHATEISQILIANQLPTYIIDTMLASSLALDLRFYKANDQLVPFRYCHPLRAEAIAMIGYTLGMSGCWLAEDIASRLIPRLGTQMKGLDIENLQALPDRMKWVESLWLFANIVGSQNQRLKYQFVNLRLHDKLTQQVDRHPFLNRFFPVMTQTLRNSQLLVSSLARSQLMTK